MATDSVMLIVDDSKLARKMIRTYAAAANPSLQFLEATNGDEALQVAGAQRISVMTIDYNMPGMNGIELATVLRREHPVARISLLTANVQDAIRQRADGIGVDFIAKPITEQKIKSFVQGA